VDAKDFAIDLAHDESDVYDSREAFNLRTHC
jgi:hypothetical protein